MAIRSLRTGDTEGRKFIDDDPAPGRTTWNDDTGKVGFKLDGPCSAAFYMTPISEPQERS